MFKYIFPALLSISCLSAHAQLVSDSLLIESRHRVFVYDKSVKVKPGASLIFIMHGSGGEPMGFAPRAAKLQARAEAENLVLVYPAGYKKYWNECRKASTAIANKENLNEEAFFSAMIDFFSDQYKINKAQVFATGFSGGGHMSYKLALTMPDKIKAISAIVANMPTDENMDCAALNVPLPVMITNGTADETNPYNGGEVKTAGVTLGHVRATDQSFQYWAKLDGYDGMPVKSMMPDGDKNNNITVEKYTYQKKGKPEVTLLKVINGKHEFLTDFDIFEETWAFFKRQMGK
ncbi:poly(3-hydroxybutyrate) depolymerase [Dyadobacter sp. LJ53]|uniref:alpha/beta hydrolase family esterase n=1 Tax=Dyadobacter chenwenxiniae TaxID=2906456 RepID=UPI001F3C6806|nr:poly(3-hydroxybutyrate) depolymerase [Dyadobacter chenwenxiniae]MCF0052150.1 poly(3-hydroxybutyrate) depolymerase [Dyadobacter chenwenxiniae]